MNEIDLGVLTTPNFLVNQFIKLYPIRIDLIEFIDKMDVLHPNYVTT